MTLEMSIITFDSVDPVNHSAWWAANFQGKAEELIPGEYILVSFAKGPQLGFQRVADPTPGKNRIHIDFGTDDVDGEAARLTAAGATEVARHDGDGGKWVVLGDPEGNAFCVVAQ